VYILTIKLSKNSEDTLILKTANRSYARFATLLFQQNGMAIEVTEEVVPRQVKFKGV